MNLKRRFGRHVTLLALAAGLGWGSVLPDFYRSAAHSQEQAEGKSTVAQTDPEQAAQTFQKLMSDWKELIKELRALKIKYQTAIDEEVVTIKQQWDEKVARGEALIPQLRAAGKAAYLAAPNADLQLSRVLLKFVEDDVARDDYEVAFDMAETLIDNKCEFKEIYNLAGIAAYCINDFDKAEQYFKQAEEFGVLSGDGPKYRPLVNKYKKYWQAEKEIREKEAQADDLPRLKLETNRGEIVIELFENEAPETVGNFVHLVSTGFYDGLTFHRVLQGFMAQGGCPKGDGTGGPDYKIYCECNKPEYRKHFRGSLSMAHAGQDTGGSQFFLTFVPTDHLNGRHTVFGRVIEGIDVLAKIKRRDPMAVDKAEPDRIVKAEVIRKRPSTRYEPNKVQ